MRRVPLIVNRGDRSDVCIVLFAAASTRGLCSSQWSPADCSSLIYLRFSSLALVDGVTCVVDLVQGGKERFSERMLGFGPMLYQAISWQTSSITGYRSGYRMSAYTDFTRDSQYMLMRIYCKISVISCSKHLYMLTSSCQISDSIRYLARVVMRTCCKISEMHSFSAAGRSAAAMQGRARASLPVG
jgi:hypothetical protein